MVVAVVVGVGVIIIKEVPVMVVESLIYYWGDLNFTVGHLLQISYLPLKFKSTKIDLSRFIDKGHRIFYSR